MIDSLSLYMNKIWQTPQTMYEQRIQEVVNHYWKDTDRIRTVKEEKYPFNQEYVEYEVWLNTVYDSTSNLDKVDTDFIQILFKDCKHKSYRGQKYIYNNETYLTYDRINDVDNTAQEKLIRCNNSISWLDDSGNIHTEKVFLGYELQSTNDSITKDGTTENRRIVLYIQGNSRTETIHTNQRFMFGHKDCFKVEQINNYNQELGLDGVVTLYRAHLVFDSFLNDRDNAELNICDYYNNVYKINIVQDSPIEQPNGYKGQLTAIVRKNNIPTDIGVVWSSSNSNVSIDSSGNYKLNGLSGTSSVITCSLSGNDSVKDTLTINIVSVAPSNPIIQVSPIISDLRQYSSQEFTVGVYLNGIKQTDVVTCVGSGTSASNYKLVSTTNGYKLTNNNPSSTPLTLTFSSGSLTPVTMNINLNGMF